MSDKRINKIFIKGKAILEVCAYIYVRVLINLKLSKKNMMKMLY